MKTMGLVCRLGSDQAGLSANVILYMFTMIHAALGPMWRC